MPSTWLGTSPAWSCSSPVPESLGLAREKIKVIIIIIRNRLRLQAAECGLVRRSIRVPAVCVCGIPLWLRLIVTCKQNSSLIFSIGWMSFHSVVPWPRKQPMPSWWRTQHTVAQLPSHQSIAPWSLLQTPCCCHASQMPSWLHAAEKSQRGHYQKFVAYCIRQKTEELCFLYFHD